MSGKTRESWRRAAIDETKRAVKSELDQVLQASGESERLNYILEQIQELESASDSQQLLRRFIFIMSGLVHHERFGGLGKKQIHDLSVLGQAILRVVGVKTGHSPNSFLHAELHSIMSDIHFSNGEFLSSLWERQLGAHSAAMPNEHQARQHMGMGICAMRLGNSQLAIHFFQKGLQETEDPLVRDRLRVHQLKATRLTGDHEACKQLFAEIQTQIQDEACLNELAWEKACLGMREEQDLSELFVLTKKGQPLYASSYLLELFFWASAHPKTQWTQRIPRLTTLASQKSLDFNRHSHLFSLAQNLEQAYETKIPFSKRLSDIKKALPKINLLRNVDQELLVWLSLTRWLYRSHHYPIASIIFYEYEALSQKLSSGRSRDVLGLAGDLLQVDWQKKTA